MRITRLKLQNFKNFDDVELHFGDVNIFVGANASGKSNLFEAIRFLRNINVEGLENAISLSGGIDLLGSIKPEHKGNLTILEIDYESQVVNLVPVDNLDDDRLLSFFDFKYSLEILQDKGSLLEIKESLWAEAHVLSAKQFWKQKTGEEGYIITLDKPRRGILASSSIKIDIGSYHRRNDLISFTPAINQTHNLFDVDGKLVAFTTEKIAKGWAFLDGLVLQNMPIFESENSTSSSSGFNPDNWGPTLLNNNLSPFLNRFDGKAIRLYDFDIKRAKGWISPATKAELEENGENLAKVVQRIQSDPHQSERFQLLVQSVLPYAKRFDVQKMNGSALSVSLKESFAPDVSLPASALSDGTITVAAIVAALFFEKNSIAMFEEPERGVHPSLLGNLVELLYEASDKQVFLTTHSPEVLNYAHLSDIFLISRDKQGSSTVIKPAEKEMVLALLAEQVSIGNLFTQQLLDH